MRAADLAGMLGEGEIGLLMHDTGTEQGMRIAERLRTVVAGDPGHGAAGRGGLGLRVF